jgi:hypothetical protein
MRLTRSDKETLIFALNLAIRDRVNAIDPDNPNEKSDAEDRAHIEKFTRLRDRLRKDLKGS